MANLLKATNVIRNENNFKFKNEYTYNILEIFLND